MTTLTPEKPTGTRCGEMIQSGIVAYRCELELGHAQVPEDDPEPHYAVEVGRTVRAWQAWKQRQMEREANPSVTVLGGVNCPNCGAGLVLSDSGEMAVCAKSCGADPVHVAHPKSGKTTEQVVAESDRVERPTYAAVVALGEGVETGVAASGTADHGSGGFLRQRPGPNAGWQDVTDLGRLNAVEELVDASCPRTVQHDHHFWEVKSEPDVYQCKGDLTDVPLAGERDPAFAATPEQEKSLVGPHRLPMDPPEFNADGDPVGIYPDDFSPVQIPSWLIIEGETKPTAEEVEKIEQAYERIMESIPPADGEMLTIIYEEGGIRTRIRENREPEEVIDQIVVAPEVIPGDAPPAVVRQTRVWSTPDLDPLNLPRVEGCGRCQEISEDPHPELITWVDFVVSHFDQDHDIVLVVGADDDKFSGWVESPAEISLIEPTKQRDGDQSLPQGGGACVQDRIIEEMEESKRVGEIRYGSVLRTFNGRDSLLDAAEEARDLHVYLTQIRMEAEVTRDQLEVVVAQRIRPLSSNPDITVEDIAAIAVDAVMGWVSGQQSQVAPSNHTG